MHRSSLAVVGVALTVLAASAASAQPRLPIFDTHVHYSEPAWREYPPDAVDALLKRAGVARALVSSTPDDGTLALNRRDADRYVPMLRPYRGGVGSSNWFQDPDLAAYLEGRLSAGIYRGIGEFHLFDARHVDTPQVRRVVELAISRDIFVHIHSNEAPVRALIALDRRLKILWAHAGMSEPPEVVGALLDASPVLWTELSFRAESIAPGGKLDDAWRALFLRHRHRFMIGTDTYVTPRWGEYLDLVEQHRNWLGQLPPDIASDIAWRNAARLFGAGNARFAVE